MLSRPGIEFKLEEKFWIISYYEAFQFIFFSSVNANNSITFFQGKIHIRRCWEEGIVLSPAHSRKFGGIPRVTM